MHRSQTACYAQGICHNVTIPQDDEVSIAISWKPAVAFHWSLQSLCLHGTTTPYVKDFLVCMVTENLCAVLWGSLLILGLDHGVGDPSASCQAKHLPHRRKQRQADAVIAAMRSSMRLSTSMTIDPPSRIINHVSPSDL